MDFDFDFDVPPRSESSVALKAPAQRENESEELLHTLNRLKNEVAFLTAEIAREEQANDQVSDNEDEIIEALLARNDRVSAKRLGIETPKVAKLQHTGVFPIHDNNLEYLAKFHNLTLNPLVTSKIVARNILQNVFEGSCRNLFRFKVDLHVKAHEQSVHSMRVETSPWIQGELKPLVERATESRDILELMFGISEYAHIYEIRFNTFEKLAKKFKADDQLWRTCDTLTFNAEDGFQIRLRWRIDTKNTKLQEPTSSPTVDISADEEHHKNDRTDALSKSKEIFNHLVEMQGVFRATCIMHEIFHGDGDDNDDGV